MLTRWERILAEFLSCHANGTNVALHLITTPMGLLGFLAAIWHFSATAAIGTAVLYSLLLAWFVPIRVWTGTTLVLAALLGMTAVLEPGIGLAAVLLIVGYVLQEIAHYVAGEHTLQSTYMHQRSWPAQLVEHTFYLLPLVLASVKRATTSPFALVVPQRKVFYCKLTSASERLDMDRIVAFVERESPPLTHTTHWWQDELRGEIGESFARLASAAPIEAMFARAFGPAYAVDVVEGMNEIYVTGPPQEVTSDNVFYTPHIDGPFPVYPFATVFRCMLAISPNERVRTHFPMDDLEGSSGYTLSDGDALAFDFHREPHYITNAPGKTSANRRISLKLHYVAYPKGLAGYGRMLGKLTTWYDKRARQLFLNTLKPTHTWDRLKANWVLWTTKFFEHLERLVGCNNLAYVAVLGLLSLVFRNPQLFLFGTSYVHYLIYIATFANRENVAYGKFVRNVVLFKGLALTQLVACYLYYFEWNLLSLAMIVGGFGIAGIACARLGKERTYFGVELGRCAPTKVQSFPYNVLPHPMILGSMIGLVGFGLLPGIRHNFPWLVPLHLLFYLVHLGQEIRDQRLSPAMADSLETPGSTAVS